jgi:hypothetical protein
MNHRTTLILCLFLSGNLIASGLSAPKIRIVDGSQPVKSVKRGLCLNEMSSKDFMAISPSVSWWYNWHYKETQNAPEAAEMEFYPMAWGDREQDVFGLAKTLKNTKPRYVMGINEPNLKDQAFISPERTANLYKKIKAVADEHGIPLIAPNMSLGSPEDGSIKAFDPVENKEMLYTFQNPFIKAVQHFLGETKLTHLASHSYGNFGELKWMTEMMHQEFGLPVWITEFAHWHAKDEEEEMDYMIQSVDFFERSPFVAGYAWFKERVEGNPKLSLLGKSGELTPLGEIYVKMPVHDPGVYYQVPGVVEAESYTTVKDADIGKTKDPQGGFLEMRIIGESSLLTYQIATAVAGRYEVQLRLASLPGTTIVITPESGSPVSFKVEGKGYQNLEGTMDLPHGPQTLKVTVTQAMILNTINFKSFN